jgi:hypothetical protein
MSRNGLKKICRLKIPFLKKKPEMAPSMALTPLRLLPSGPDLVQAVPLHEIPGKEGDHTLFSHCMQPPTMM